MTSERTRNRTSPKAKLIPALEWLPGYSRSLLAGDLIAGTVVAIILVPQAMAYAMLAGLPPEIGLYASTVPLMIYAALGSSRVLAVGPVAIVSLLVANSIADIGDGQNALFVAGALASLSGLILMALGFARLGFLVNFVSHPVIAGFSSAAALVIAISQIKTVLGFDIPRSESVIDTVSYAVTHLGETNPASLALASLAVVLLVLWPRLFARSGQAPETASLSLGVLGKAGPLVVVTIGISAVAIFRLDLTKGVGIVGAIPQGLPGLTMPRPDWQLWSDLLSTAFVIALVGYMESIAVAKTLASKKRQQIDANQELIALGAANLSAGLASGYPVTGGLSRSVVNFSSGANTQLASVVTAILIVLTVLVLTPLLFFLPNAVLASIIVVAVAKLVDMPLIIKTWRYNKADAFALLVTFLVVLFYGVEPGVLAGIALSIGLFLFRTSRPHIAIVGRVGDTEHFRNIKRHSVHTDPKILAIRVDESLYFANTRYLEDFLLRAVADADQVEHVVLILSAVNFVDTSALESLETLIDRLRDFRVTVHLAEVKGPVMDQFERSDILKHLEPGRVFLSTDHAMRALS